jgi:hypothetical protein
LKMKRRPKMRDSEKLFGEMFARAAAEPVAWRLHAHSLMRAAAALKPLMEADNRAMADPSATELEHPVVEVYMLLTGLAIETLAKARIVAGHSSPTESGRLAKDLKSHDLLNLVRRAGITLNEAESYLCERLEAFVVWAGRYPIASNLEDYLPRTAPRGGWGPMSVYYSSDPEMIEELVEKLSADAR